MAEPSRGYGSASWMRSTPFVLWRANTVVHNRLQAALAPLGLTISQWGILEHLDEFGALAGADIARGIHLTPQSVNTAVNAMEKLGLVERTSHPHHGRLVLWALTSAGTEAALEGRALVASVRAEVDAVLADIGSLECLYSGLAGVVEALDGPQESFVPRWSSPGDR